MNPVDPTYEQQDRERILRLQCLAAAEPSPIQVTAGPATPISWDALLKRAQEVYDFVTANDAAIKERLVGPKPYFTEKETPISDTR